MKSLLLPLLFLFAGSTLVRAQDTLYLGADRQPIKKKKNALYFKVTTKTDTGYVLDLLDKNEKVTSRTTYKDPDLKILHGYSVGYYSDSKGYDGRTKGSEGTYSNGKHDGKWIYYRPGGSVSGIVHYKNGERISEEYFKPDGQKETDPGKIEQLPSFPGGNKGLGIPNPNLKISTSSKGQTGYGPGKSGIHCFDNR